MAQGTHICGVQSCAETLRIVLGRMTWQAIGLLALASLVFLNALMVTFRVLGLGRNLALEKGLMRRHAMRGVCYERDEAAPFYCDMNEEDSNLRKRWSGSGGKKSV